MKTRSNMPLFVLEVSNVKALSNSQIDLLRCGDWLVKKDASGEHPYQVTFKKEGVGMCLTYHDASVIETQSYDWNNSQKKWVYNSEDKTPNLLDALVPSDITGGTLENAKPIYWHGIEMYKPGDGKGVVYFHILKNDSAPFDTIQKVIDWITSFTEKVMIQCNGIINYSSENRSIYSIYKPENTNEIRMIASDSVDTYKVFNNVSLTSLFSTISDGVNKIN